MEKERLNDIETMLANDQIDACLAALAPILESGGAPAQAWLLAGKAHMRRQSYGDAINAFGQALDIDPGNAEAKTRIEVIRGILNISNSFYYENTYLDDSIYE